MTQPSLLTAALYYAEKLHLHIFPCHEAIFNNEGECVGCTCEAWKRTQAKYGPDYKCPKPGKCPRVKWKEKATNDPQTIRRWWSRWPTANIAWVPGRDGYITLDLDNYKKHFAGAAALSPDEQRTITNQSQAGGQHLIYRKPEGATYSNSPGELPKGLDVRADNGYILLPPSLGESGNRYQRKPGMWFGEIEAQRLPDRIHSMLVGIGTGYTNGATPSRRRTPSAPAAQPLGEPASVAPDLDAFGLSRRILRMIFYPPAKGDRSEPDISVCLGLCYAGATDAEILSVFSHYPIGRLGKFAERGQGYLSLTIDKARGYMQPTPTPEPTPDPTPEPLPVPAVPDAPGIPLSQIVAAAYDWLLTAECAEKLRSAGFVRLEGVRKTLGALLDIAKTRGLRFIPGLRQIAEVAGCSLGTVSAHLDKFQKADLVEVVNTDAGQRLYLKFVVSYLNTRGSLLTVYPCSDNSRQTFWHDHKADDAFQTYPYHAAMRRRQAPTVLADSLGSSAALVWHLLAEHGELTRVEICELSGMTKNSVATATRKLESAGLVLVEQEHPRSPKSYSLHPDAEQRLDERRPEMKSAGVGKRRQLHHAEDQLKIARRQGKLKRVMRLEEKYNALHRAAHGDTGDENPAFWIRGRVRKRSSRWDTWERQRQIEALQAVYVQVHDLPIEVQRRWLGEAGYNEEDIRLIVSKRVWLAKAGAYGRSMEASAA